MSLLSSLYQQQQQINQQPTSAVRTPIQTAYDNLLNAQSNAQNTAKEEWGSAIGNSVNGLAKIIASSVIGNPIEKAASTRNLDNFDARQDALVRQWAMEQAKKRNDFVNQAREQLGMAKADEEQAYNRQQDALKFAYKQAQDQINNDLNREKWDWTKERAKVSDEQWQKQFEANQQKADREYQLRIDELEFRMKNATTQKEKDDIALQIQQEQLKKLQRENDPEYIKQQEEQAKQEVIDKKNADNIKLADTYAGREEITPELNMAIKNNPELANYLISSGKYNEGSFLGNTFKKIGFDTGKNPNKYTLDFAQILRDKGIEPTKEAIKMLKKDLGVME